MKTSLQLVEKRIVNCDISLFAPIKTSLTNGDKKSFLAIQNEMRSKKKEYIYLEIGSYFGGSLQTLLLDTHCRCIYSIDSRVSRDEDARGEIDYYPHNTSSIMQKKLRRDYSGYMSKLVTITKETKDVTHRDVVQKPDMCFIDGHHTDQAVFNDFLFCLSVGSPNVLLIFHDVHMIFGGLRKSIEYLKKKNIPFQSFMLPSSLGVVAIRHSFFSQSSCLEQRLAHSLDGVFYCLESLSVYRDYYKATKNNGIISTIMRLFGLIKVHSVTE